MGLYCGINGVTRKLDMLRGYTKPIVGYWAGIDGVSRALHDSPPEIKDFTIFPVNISLGKYDTSIPITEDNIKDLNNWTFISADSWTSAGTSTFDDYGNVTIDNSNNIITVNVTNKYRSIRVTSRLLISTVDDYSRDFYDLYLALNRDIELTLKFGLYFNNPYSGSNSAMYHSWVFNNSYPTGYINSGYNNTFTVNYSDSYYIDEIGCYSLNNPYTITSKRTFYDITYNGKTYKPIVK